jgi:hypothetical protein
MGEQRDPVENCRDEEERRCERERQVGGKREKCAVGKLYD